VTHTLRKPDTVPSSDIHSVLADSEKDCDYNPTITPDQIELIQQRQPAVDFALRHYHEQSQSVMKAEEI
jgi:hypothetical protein